jgi:general secretion pathway protein C
MRIARTVVAVLVPMAIATAAFLDARAVSELVAATMEGSVPLPSVAAARASTGAAAGATSAGTRPDAAAILDRNPFDHATGSLRTPPGQYDDAETAPSCDGIRPVVIVGSDDPDASFAALEASGRRVLRKRGGEVNGMRVAFVGADRVWLERGGSLCQARLFDPHPHPPATPTATRPPADVIAGIKRAGPNEIEIDRGTLERLFEDPGELMKTRIVPDKAGGARVVAVKPGTVVATLGIESGDRLLTINGFDVSSPEKMLEAYARLRTGATHVTVRLDRGGRTMDLEYAIR